MEIKKEILDHILDTLEELNAKSGDANNEYIGLLLDDTYMTL